MARGWPGREGRAASSVRTGTDPGPDAGSQDCSRCLGRSLTCVSSSAGTGRPNDGRSHVPERHNFCQTSLGKTTSQRNVLSTSMPVAPEVRRHLDVAETRTAWAQPWFPHVAHATPGIPSGPSPHARCLLVMPGATQVLPPPGSLPGLPALCCLPACRQPRILLLPRGLPAFRTVSYARVLHAASRGRDLPSVAHSQLHWVSDDTADFNKRRLFMPRLNRGTWRRRRGRRPAGRRC